MLSLLPGPSPALKASLCAYSTISVDSLEITGFNDSEIFCRITFSQVKGDTCIKKKKSLCDLQSDLLGLT